MRCGEVQVAGRIGPEPLQAAVGEIADQLPVSRPAVSQHLKVLKDAGLVAERVEGTRRMYRLNPAGVAAMRDQLDAFWNRALAGYSDAVERPKPASIFWISRSASSRSWYSASSLESRYSSIFPRRASMASCSASETSCQLTATRSISARFSGRPMAGAYSDALPR